MIGATPMATTKPKAIKKKTLLGENDFDKLGKQLKNYFIEPEVSESKDDKENNENK